MTRTEEPGLVHSSVRTATSINVDADGSRSLVVTTARLSLVWRDGMLTTAFEMHRAKASLDRSAVRRRPVAGQRR